jgi:hypothetical protein
MPARGKFKQQKFQNCAVFQIGITLKCEYHLRKYSAELMTMENAVSVPDDFPRQGYSATSISGVQPKLAVRLVNGTYIDGLTPEELAVRYEICNDLVQQLASYCARKIREKPDTNADDLLTKVHTAAAAKGWDISRNELEWIMSKVKVSLETSAKLSQ